MATVRRFDFGEIRKPVRLDNGWLRTDALITRTGVFAYRQPDGTIRHELRPPEEVFHEDALESFNLAPVTVDHPPVGILDSRTTRTYQKGSVSHVRKDGANVKANVLLTDEDAIDEAMKHGRRQLSCGYTCDTEETPGVTSGIPGVLDGQRYDAIQRNIRGNHVALVYKARAGENATLRLDARDAEMDEGDELIALEEGDESELREDAGWDEDSHPRDEAGRFAAGAAYDKAISEGKSHGEAHDAAREASMKAMTSGVHATHPDNMTLREEEILSAATTSHADKAQAKYNTAAIQEAQGRVTAAQGSTDKAKSALEKIEEKNAAMRAADDATNAFAMGKGTTAEEAQALHLKAAAIARAAGDSKNGLRHEDYARKLAVNITAAGGTPAAVPAPKNTGRPPKGTPTDTNLSATAELFPTGETRVSNAVPRVSAPHVRRAIAAGLVKVEGKELVLTPEGQKAIGPHQKSRDDYKARLEIERTQKVNPAEAGKIHDRNNVDPHVRSLAAMRDGREAEAAGKHDEAAKHFQTASDEALSPADKKEFSDRSHENLEKHYRAQALTASAAGEHEKAADLLDKANEHSTAAGQDISMRGYAREAARYRGAAANQARKEAEVLAAVGKNEEAAARFRDAASHKRQQARLFAAEGDGSSFVDPAHEAHLEALRDEARANGLHTTEDAGKVGAKRAEKAHIEAAHDAYQNRVADDGPNERGHSAAKDAAYQAAVEAGATPQQARSAMSHVAKGGDALSYDAAMAKRDQTNRAKRVSKAKLSDTDRLALQAQREIKAKDVAGEARSKMNEEHVRLTNPNSPASKEEIAASTERLKHAGADFNDLIDTAAKTKEAFRQSLLKEPAPKRTRTDSAAGGAAGQAAHSAYMDSMDEEHDHAGAHSFATAAARAAGASKQEAVAAADTAAYAHRTTCDVCEGEPADAEEENVTSEENEMRKIKLDGIEHEVGDIAAQAFENAIGKRDTELSTMKARLDKAEEELATAKKSVPGPAEIAALAGARVLVLRSAEKMLPSNHGLKLDGLSDLEVKAAAVKAIAPASKEKIDAALAKNDAAYIGARFDAAVEDLSAAEEGNEGLGRIRGASQRTDASEEERGETTSLEKARQKMAEEGRTAWQKKGA